MVCVLNGMVSQSEQVNGNCEKVVREQRGGAGQSTHTHTPQYLTHTHTHLSDVSVKAGLHAVGKEDQRVEQIIAPTEALPHLSALIHLTSGWSQQQTHSQSQSPTNLREDQRGKRKREREKEREKESNVRSSRKRRRMKILRRTQFVYYFTLKWGGLI